MASSGFYISSMLLLSLLVISSATDYGYSTPTPPQLEKPKPQDKLFPSKSDCEEKEKHLPKKLEHEKPTYEKEEGHVPPTKPDYEVKPVYKDTKPEGKDKKFLPNKKLGYGSEPKPDDEKQKYVPEKPKPTQGKYDKLIDHLPTNFDVQGLVLCKSGAHYFPLQGTSYKLYKSNNA